jgi:hypothetical protein
MVSKTSIGLGYSMPASACDRGLSGNPFRDLIFDQIQDLNPFTSLLFCRVPVREQLCELSRLSLGSILNNACCHTGSASPSRSKEYEDFR